MTNKIVQYLKYFMCIDNVRVPVCYQNLLLLYTNYW
jgi:hypothetical protein